MSLYQKYRPNTFADVTGQDHVVSTLENAVNQDKLSHAYLFAGLRGTGKTSVARILAKAMLTKGVEDETLQKLIERGVEEGTIVDLTEIDAASNRGIDDIRELVEKIQFSPVVGSAKVYIIDEVHMLTREAFNALLKTLEEPPPYAYFILATTELQKIPATIQSRCQRFTFRQIREEDIVRRLQFIADQEHITVDRGALRAISHHAQGGMRDAISLLDQLRSLEKISAEDVRERIGETGQEYVQSVFDALDTGNAQVILDLVARLEETGIPLDIFVRQLMMEAHTRLHAFSAEGKPIDFISRLLNVLLSAVRDIRISPVPALVLETSLLSLMDTGSQPSVQPSPKEARKAKKEEERVEAKKTSEPMPAKAEKETPAAMLEEKSDMSDALVEAPELTLDTVLSAWPGIVTKATPAALKMSLKNGRVTAVTDKTVTVSFPSKFHRDRVAHNEGSHTIEDLLQEHFKRSLRLECIVDGGADSASQKTGGSQVDLAAAVAEIF